MTLEEVKKKIYDSYGNVDYEILEFSTARAPFKVKCLKCGNVSSVKYMSNFFRKTRKNFCSYCANTYKGNKIGSLLPLEEAQARIDEAFPNEYRIVPEKYDGWSRKGIIQHKCGKYFECQPRDLLYHSHCPCIKIISKGESRIKKFLEENKITFEEQKRIPNITKAPFDFYLPDYNLLIEFQGRQHYEPVEKFGGIKQLEKQQEIDKRKKEIAKQQGYDILYISYREMSLIEDTLVQRLSLTGEQE